MCLCFSHLSGCEQEHEAFVCSKRRAPVSGAGLQGLGSSCGLVGAENTSKGHLARMSHVPRGCPAVSRGEVHPENPFGSVPGGAGAAGERCCAPLAVTVAPSFPGRPLACSALRLQSFVPLNTGVTAKQTGQPAGASGQGSSCCRRFPEPARPSRFCSWEDGGRAGCGGSGCCWTGQEQQREVPASPGHRPFCAPLPIAFCLWCGSNVPRVGLQGTVCTFGSCRRLVAEIWIVLRVIFMFLNAF